MKLTFALRDIILESSRLEFLIDKYAKDSGEKGKKTKSLMDLTRLAEIIFADPTTKKPEGFDTSDYSVENLSKIQPGAYTNWLLKNYATPTLTGDLANIEPNSPAYKKEVERMRELFMEDIFKVTGDLKKFTKFKQYFPVDKRDINKFTPESLFTFLQSFELPENLKKKKEKEELKKEIRKERKGFSHPGANVEFVGDKYTVAKIEGSGPKQQEAASWYGGYYDYENGESRWCTSPPDSSYFKRYANDGPLYVVLANDDGGAVGKRTGLPQERYQFHFPSNQFMDRLDHSINLVEFLNTKAPELKEYFKPEFAKGMTTQGGKRVEIEYPQSSAAKFIALYGFEEFFNSLPSDIENLLFNNKSKEKIALDIPQSIGKFTNLEALLLMNCVKSLPNTIGNLKNLSFLALPDNPQLASIPDSILQLDNLMFVNLKGSNVKLSDAFLNTFGEEGSSHTGFYSRIV